MQQAATNTHFEMKLLLIIFFLFAVACKNVKGPTLKSDFNVDSVTCQRLDFLKLQDKKLQNIFFKQLDSTRHIQYPNNDQEKEIMIDLNQKLLDQFLKDIDQTAFSKTGRFEKEYHFNIAPKGYSDPAICKDKISIEFYPENCSYRMMIWNTFLAEPDWCTESQVIYSFEIKGDKIAGFERNEAG